MFIPLTSPSLTSRQEHGYGYGRVRVRVATPCTCALTGAGTGRHTMHCYPYPYPRKVFPWIHYTTWAPTSTATAYLPTTAVVPSLYTIMGDTGTNFVAVLRFVC